MYLGNDEVFVQFKFYDYQVSVRNGRIHVQDKVSRFSELPEPMRREDHRFLSPQLSNPRKQV